MYAAPYGYQGSNNPGQFIPNPTPNANANPGHGVPSLSHQQQTHSLHPHLQQQQPGQQSQHMMFNPQQQYAASQYAQGQGGQSLGGMPGAMGMMQQNNGMAAGPHASPYQTPYSSSGYVGNMPTSTAPGLPPNFMPTSGAPSYQMNAPNMNLQLQAQRMQPPPTSSTPTQPGGSRASPFVGALHNTPPHSTLAQQQFSTPQSLNQTQSQTPSNSQQAQAGMILTPQTPNFPPGAQGMNVGSSMATPLSPGSEVREKERVTVLLEINKYLLMEVMRLQAVQAESKKEDSAASSPDATEKEKADKEKERMEKAKPATRDYFECMRRLQGNLAYLAAIADRSHKPSSQIPPHPAIMTAPPLSPRSPQPSIKTSPSPKAESIKKEESAEDFKPEGLEDDHGESLREQYKKLQALFPGVDFKKAEQAASNAARQQASQQAAMAKQQGGNGTPAVVADIAQQQKMQNEMLRQKMIQAQQAQQQAQQQQAASQNR